MVKATQDEFISLVHHEFCPEQESHAGIPVLTASFWTAAQRQGHSLHEISYRACFKPELPRFLISRLSQPGDCVLDPFMGRGTTILEAALLGRRPFGNDVNPLSTLLVRPRLRALSGVREWLETPFVTASANDLVEAESLGLREFYHENTLGQVCALRRRLLMETSAEGDGVPEAAADWVRMVALNRLTGHSPGFFSGRTMPPNQAVSAASQRRINQRLGVQPPERNVKDIILAKTRSLLRHGQPQEADAVLSSGEASQLQSVTSESISLVVTSPPFLDIVQYADDNWLRCWFGGIDSQSVPMGIHKTVSAWETMMSQAMLEMHRVLKPGGHAAIEVGEVRKGTVRLEEAVIRAAASTGLIPLVVLVNKQVFTKTASLWGVSNMKGGTNTNRIVVLRKP